PAGHRAAAQAVASAWLRHQTAGTARFREGGLAPTLLPRVGADRVRMGGLLRNQLRGDTPSVSVVGMAEEVLIAGSESRAKIRNPWGVLGLGIITLGIYLIFWWYYVNREMRDLGHARGVSGLGENPGLSTVAYALGGFLLAIPTIWTVVTTTQRV